MSVMTLERGGTIRSIEMPDEYSVYLAALFLRVSPDSLRRWEAAGKVAPARRTSRGDRYYTDADLNILSDWQAGKIPDGQVPTAQRKARAEERGRFL